MLFLPSGLYSCVATNHWGSSMTRQVRVSFASNQRRQLRQQFDPDNNNALDPVAPGAPGDEGICGHPDSVHPESVDVPKGFQVIQSASIFFVPTVLH